MAWTNPDLTLFHGTLERHANSILSLGVNLAHGRVSVDFGQGFYLTTSRHQAEQWANTAQRRAARQGGSERAAVLSYDIDRNALAACATLIFTLEASDSGYWDFVAHCRGSVTTTHACTLAGRIPGDIYDVVVGPVTVWPQSIVLKDCDQWSFHTPEALDVLPSHSVPGDAGTLHLPPGTATRF